ncbi:MAG TPA: hypothetical protein PLH29_04255 [bacterium]|nr:hypothetical protein [bacterium]
MLITVLVATGLFMIIATGAVSLATLRYKLNIAKVAKVQALHVAEAGVNYYRWVLYHEHKEYCNKEACQPGPSYGPYGPYTFKDSADGSIIGYYELYITPPAINGSTIVKIRSVGWLASFPSIKRSIEVRCGIPSWSSYSTLADDNMRFGEGTEVWGPIHSNKGIRFDGLSHNVISSSLLEYDDPDHTGSNEFGVHTHVNPPPTSGVNNNFRSAEAPPNEIPTRNDVFLAGRSTGVASISFSLLNNYANEVYQMATSAGIVFDPSASGTADPYSVPEYWDCGTSGSTCDEGFYITLRTDNKFDIRGVTSVYPTCSGNASNSIYTQESTVRTYDIPANGIIFVKNNVWVDGQINNSRVTILAFKEPFTGGDADININNNLLYTNYDGLDAIGLIAQRSVNIGQYSADVLRIDAALIARDGRIGRNHYGLTCTNYSRNIITVYGSLATKNRYGFAYTDGTGYQTRNLIYDNNLTFAPPPHYPTTGEYTFISWKEN